MMLPALGNLDETRNSLHAAAQVIGVVRQVSVEPQPNWLHLALTLTPNGVTTGPLRSGGELRLDYGRGVITYQPEGQHAAEVPLAGHTQVSLTDTVLETLKRFGQTPAVNRDKLTGTTALNLDAQLAADYAGVQYRLFTALARFRARLLGGQSPIVLWPHNFDLSFLLFANPDMSENGLHAAFGFEPRSPGLERPYFYAYVRPTPEGLTSQPLPPLARWHTEGWTGAVIQYDDLHRQAEPELALENHLLAIYAAFKRFLV